MVFVKLSDLNRKLDWQKDHQLV